PLDADDNMFVGMAFCADCGRRMYHSRTRVKNIRPYFLCANRALYRCTRHRIWDEELERAVREELEAKIRYVKAHREELRKGCKKVSHGAKEAEECRQRIEALDQMIMKLYEDRVTGMVDDATFKLLITKFTEEKEEKKKRIQEIRELEQNGMGEKVERFLELVDGYEGFSRDSLRSLVEKVLVHEDGKHVDLVLMHVGSLIDGAAQATGA
ncbi:MAG: zinc ribbon domain-containing protein, partial [Blautia sp.]|nr:zinc ribbon domain-containing protein [Blautia sp.]